jgi:hypothetical protein
MLDARRVKRRRSETMKSKLLGALVAGFVVVAGYAAPALASNIVTIDTPDAYSGQHGVRVDVFCHNEVGLLEYFNLIVFDDTRLEYAGVAADRGQLYGTGPYPTHVDGNRIYIHGVATSPSYCIPPDTGTPGSPLYHIVFNVKSGAAAGAAAVVFSSEGPWDGHWNDCSGLQITPTPTYYNGGVNVLGHAAVVTIGNDSTAAGESAAVDVYLHNDLDVFEYFHRIHFDAAVASVDSIVALRGALNYGFYPTHVSGDTIFVHGWAGNGGCFNIDSSVPGAGLYRIFFAVDGGAAPGSTMPVIYLGGDAVWDHWVGCDLVTTDSFDSVDGSVYVTEATGIAVDRPLAKPFLGPVVPNPTAGAGNLRYYLPQLAVVTASVFDAAGRRVRVLESGSRARGWHRLDWDGIDDRGRRVASGVYFVRLKTATEVYSRKVTVVR